MPLLLSVENLSGSQTLERKAFTSIESTNLWSLGNVVHSSVKKKQQLCYISYNCGQNLLKQSQNAHIFHHFSACKQGQVCTNTFPPPLPSHNVDLGVNSAPKSLLSAFTHNQNAPDL